MPSFTHLLILTALTGVTSLTALPGQAASRFRLAAAPDWGTDHLAPDPIGQSERSPYPGIDARTEQAIRQQTFPLLVPRYVPAGCLARFSLTDESDPYASELSYRCGRGEGSYQIHLRSISHGMGSRVGEDIGQGSVGHAGLGNIDWYLVRHDDGERQYAIEWFTPPVPTAVVVNDHKLLVHYGLRIDLKPRSELPAAEAEKIIASFSLLD